MMKDKSPLAGCTVKIKPTSNIRKFFKDTNFECQIEIEIEDWWENVSGKSWMVCDGNPACITYAIRSAASGLPLDNQVLYGKIGGLGYLVHTTELDLL